MGFWPDLNCTVVPFYGSYNFRWNKEFVVWSDHIMIYMWNVLCCVLFHLPLSKFQSDQYLLRCIEIKAEICQKYRVFDSHSTNIVLIVNRTTGGGRAPKTEYDASTSSWYTFRIQKLHPSEKCPFSRGGFSVETGPYAAVRVVGAVQSITMVPVRSQS
jgi:hypothetical protein